ncbi:MAG: GHKL domain-containing protein [Clostridium sp.]
MYSIISNILYVLIVTLNIAVIINNITMSKLAWRHTFGLIVVNFILIYLLSIYHQDLFSVPFTTIITIIYLYAIFKKIAYAIIISVSTQIIFALSDAFAGIIFMFIFRLDYYEIINNKIIYFIVAFTILLLSIILSKLLNLFFKRSKYAVFIETKGKSLILPVLCLIISLISIYSFLLMVKGVLKTYNRLVAVINFSIICIFTLLLNIITYLINKNYKEKLDKEYKDKELLRLNEYTSMIENQSDDLRKFKHDYANIIKIIGYYIDLGDINKLKAFYKEELFPQSEKIITKNMSFTKLQNIKINSLKVFISSKVNIAEKRNIGVHIEIEEDINEISIGLIDLCRIIGVFFDNAIEAAELCQEKFIDFVVIKEEDNVSFIISNSCLESTPPVHSLYKKDFSTKGNNRGIGLKSVMNIINKNYSNVFLNTTIENCVFKQEFIIYRSK